MSETDKTTQAGEGKDYAAQIKSQQEEWDALGEDGQEKFMEQKEAIEAEDADEEESAAIIKEHLIQHNENKKNPAYLVRGAELMCSQGSNKRMMNLSPCHGVYIKAHAVVHELDCIQGDEENITWFGICTPGEELETEQIQLIGDDGKKCHGKKCKPHILGTWLESYDQTKIVDNGNKLPKEDGEIEGCNTLTMDSFLVCKHGGIIMPINSGQDREVGAEEFDYATEEERVEALNRVQKGCTGEEEEMDCEDLLYMKLENQAERNVHGSEYEKEDMNEDNGSSDYSTGAPYMSKEGMMALMELEVLNEYSLKKGYLVVENGRLIGIKPHLVGDGGITVGFGDYLSKNDLTFYEEKGYHLSTQESDFNQIKDVVIPVEVCFEKFLADVDSCYKSLKKQIDDGELRELSQQEMDALMIGKYQTGSLGADVQTKVNANAGKDELKDEYMENRAKYKDRIDTELDIYFDGNYEVAGGLGCTIVVDEWEKHEKN